MVVASSFRRSVVLKSVCANFHDTRSQEQMGSYANSENGPWAGMESSSSNRRIRVPWGHSRKFGWYRKPWEVKEEVYLRLADEYWQLESSGTWVQYRGGSKTGECWRRDGSGEWALQPGGSNAEDGLTVGTSVTTNGDPYVTSSWSSSTAMLRLTTASSAPPALLKDVEEDGIMMVRTKDGKKIYPVTIMEILCPPDQEWWG